MQGHQCSHLGLLMAEPGAGLCLSCTSELMGPQGGWQRLWWRIGKPNCCRVRPRKSSTPAGLLCLGDLAWEIDLMVWGKEPRSEPSVASSCSEASPACPRAAGRRQARPGLTQPILTAGCSSLQWAWAAVGAISVICPVRSILLADGSRDLGWLTEAGGRV